MITSFQFNHIKGRSGNYVLAPITALLGDNRAGKTAALDTLWWLMLNYHPRLGKTNAAIFKLASDSWMDGRLTTDNHGQVFRKLEKRGDKITKTESADCEFDAAGLDSSIYWALSPAARIAKVASFVKAAELPGFIVPELLAGVKNIRIETNSEASEKAIEAIYATLAEYPRDGTPLQWLEASIEQVKAALKAANDTAKRMTALNVGMTQLQASDEEAVVQSGAVERKLAAARAELDVLQNAAGAAAEAVNETKRRKDRRDELTGVAKPALDEAALVAERDALARRIVASKRFLLERPSQAKDLLEALTRVKSEREAALDESEKCKDRADKHAKVALPEGKNEKVLAIEIAELKISLSAYEDDAAERPETTSALSQRLYSLKADKQAKAELYRQARIEISTLKADISKFMACAECPTCRASGQGWQERWKSEQDAKLAKLQADLDASALAGTQIKNTIEVTEKDLHRLGEEDVKIAGLKAKLAAAQCALSLSATGWAAYRAAQSSLAEARDDSTRLTDLAASLEKRIIVEQEQHDAVAAQDAAHAAMEAQHSGIVTTLAQAQAALNAWNAAQSELTAMPAADLPGAQALHKRQEGLVAAKKLEIDGLDEQKNAVVAQRAELKRQMEAVRAAEAAQAQVAVLKQAKELLEEKQAALVAMAFSKLLVVVNKFTSVIIPHSIIYRAEDGLGYVEGGVFVSASTLSGSEEAVLFVGLCVALAHDAKQKIVVIDEMSRFDAKNKSSLLRRLIDLINDGTIHQAILIDVDGAAYSGIVDNQFKSIKIS